MHGVVSACRRKLRQRWQLEWAVEALAATRTLHEHIRSGLDAFTSTLWQAVFRSASFRRSARGIAQQQPAIAVMPSSKLLSRQP